MNFERLNFVLDNEMIQDLEYKWGIHVVHILM